MTQIVLVGLGAGAAAALLFASVTSGALVSILLFYLAPLPILIAGLGWSHWCGLIAAITASACLGLAFGMLFFAAFLVGIAAPAWWLGYLALLARPGAAGSGADVEWYPPGRLVLWAAALGAVVVTIALFQVGTDEESIRTGLKAGLERMFRLQTGTAADQPLSLARHLGAGTPARSVRRRHAPGRGDRQRPHPDPQPVDRGTRGEDCPAGSSGRGRISRP